MDSPVVTANKVLTQNISFNGSDKEYSAETIAENVTVNCSSGKHNQGSSKVKLTNVVDYNWELRFHVGQLLAVHLNGRVIAYGISGKQGDMIRIANLETNQRALIKEMNGAMLDLSFALIHQQIILACVDEEGNLFVYNIEDKSDSIECTLILHVTHPDSDANNYRVIWCPYVPSFDEDSDTLDDPAKLLVFLNGNKVEVWDISVVNSRLGVGPFQPHIDCEGLVEINAHAMDVIDASFSPDGTALATASLDGYVKFFQVYMVETDQPRCLHEWVPHNGAAVSCLLFLDNIQTYGPDSRFWKYAVTGAHFNSELKIWSCESWSCLQTITFIANPNSPTPELYMKACLDMTAQYLLLSDINNRIMYVLHIDKNNSDGIAAVSSISEFLLPAPILSYCITSAEICRFRYTSSSDDLCLCEANEDETNIAAIVIKIYAVQPKKLQECTITFQTETLLSINCENMFTVNESSDTLVKLNKENGTDKNDITNLNDLQSTVDYLIQQKSKETSLNLMTPDAFTSPVLTSPNNKRNSHGSELTSSPVIIKPGKISEDNNIENLIDVDTVLHYEGTHKDNFASVGSSPSREVEEILSFKNKSEYFENLKKITPSIEPQNKYDETKNLFTENNVWPNISIMKANEIVEEETRKLVAAESNVVGAAYTQMNLRIAALENVVNEQNSHMQNLDHGFTTLMKTLKSDKDEMKDLISKELEVSYSKNQLQQAKMYEKFVTVRNTIDREHQDNLITNIAQVMTKQLIDKLQITMCHELNNALFPTILSTFENLKHQLLMDCSQKLSVIDRLLQDNISKLVNSKVVADSLSTSIVNIIKPSLEECYKEMVGTTLIPSLERVCGTMFQQIHDTFTKGTKEYAASVENYIDKQRHAQDKGTDLICQMQNVADSIKKNSDKLLGNMSSEIERQINLSFSSMQERLTVLLSSLVSDQLTLGFKNHISLFEDSFMNAVRSRTVTPSPHIVDSQAQLIHIKQFLAKGQIQAAFQQALSASDLSLVLHVCEAVNPVDVFKPGNCPLPQPVILSLIQQLSADLNHNSELKFKYIEEALMSLEPTNAITKEHIPIVLKELLQKLNAILSSPNCSNKSIRNIRMLQIVAQSLLKP